MRKTQGVSAAEAARVDPEYDPIVVNGSLFGHVLSAPNSHAPTFIFRLILGLLPPVYRGTVFLFLPLTSPPGLSPSPPRRISIFRIRACFGRRIVG